MLAPEPMTFEDMFHIAYPRNRPLPLVVSATSPVLWAGGHSIQNLAETPLDSRGDDG
jgi:hypothetical protein